MEINLESVKRLRLEPGDTLVLSGDLDQAQIEYLSEQMQDVFPGHKTVVLTPDLELQVVSAPPEG